MIEIRGVEKTYRRLDGSAVRALEPVTLDVHEREFVSLVGPSGCGKTTLLMMIAGLIPPTGGEIRLRGERLSGPSRDFGVVFQTPVLLPWRRVLGNLTLPIDILGLRPRERYVERARELLVLVGLQGFEHALPRELSGGMQQRAAIARALVHDSTCLLMDEPFGALDAMTREEMNLELLRIWRISGRTIVFVTHNIPEAVLLGDRVVVMSSRPGRVVDVVDVGLPRPRDFSLLGDPRFGRLTEHIRALLSARSALVS
jgi:NitT/TauT family transport system ATP-binding protein